MTEALTEYSPEQKSILLETVCKGVKAEEFLFMMELAKKYKLDPFARQIYATKVGIIISRDGYLAIAHRHPDFNGMNTSFEHDEKGNIISSTTTVWRKGIDHPFIETAYWNEYAKDSQVWKQYKHPMMQKCSERLALSKAFCITGLYADAELLDNPDSPDTDDAIVPLPIITVDGEPVTVERMKAAETPMQEPPKPENVLCTCGNIPMIDLEREKYEAAFKEQGLGEIPPNLCKICVEKLWRFRTDEKKKNPYGMKPVSSPESTVNKEGTVIATPRAPQKYDTVSVCGTEYECKCYKCGSALNKSQFAGAAIFAGDKVFCKNCDSVHGIKKAE